jgi:hypothetical protein
MDLVEPSLGLGFDSAIKVLEVTAQEIVDRINKPIDDKVDGDKLFESSSGTRIRRSDSGLKEEQEQGSKSQLETKVWKRSTSTSSEPTGNEGRSSGNTSAQSSVDKAGDTVEVEASGSPGGVSRKDSAQIIQNQKVGELLNDLQVIYQLA